MTTIYPFARQGHNTQIDNEVFDTIMSHLTGMELKLLLTIIRNTDGWHKEEDSISYSQFAKMSGAGSASTIKKSLDGLKEKGLISIQETSKSNAPYIYKLNREFPITLKSVAVTNTTQTVVAGTPQNRELPLHFLETQKKEEKETKRNTTAKAPNPVFEVYLSLEEIQRGINKGQTLTGSKRLLKAGFKKDDIVNCAKWLKADPWWQGKNIPININAIEQRIDGWIKDGRPLTHKDSTASPNKPNVPEFASDGGVW